MEAVSVLLQIDASEGNKVITVRSPLQVRLLSLPAESAHLSTCLNKEIIIHENNLAKIAVPFDFFCTLTTVCYLCVNR